MSWAAFRRDAARFISHDGTVESALVLHVRPASRRRVNRAFTNPLNIEGKAESVVSQAAVVVMQFLAVPAHRREQIAEQINRFAAPTALFALAVLAYKFWA